MRQTAGNRTIGLVYASYFAVAIASVGVARWPALGESLELLSTIIYVVLAVLFYRLFVAINRTAATAALVFGVAGCAVQAYAIAAHAAPSIQHLALAFFGAFCLMLAYLIAVSSYIPKIFAVLLGAAGIGWFCYAAPTLAARAAIFAQLVGFLAELALMLWLLIRGDGTPKAATYLTRR